MLIRQVCRTLRGTGGAGPRPAQGATLFAAAENRELGVGHRPGDRCHQGVSVGATIGDHCSHYVAVAALGPMPLAPLLVWTALLSCATLLWRSSRAGFKRSGPFGFLALVPVGLAAVTTLFAPEL